MKENTLVKSAFSTRQRCCLLDYLCYIRSDLSSRVAVTVMVKEHIVASVLECPLGRQWKSSELQKLN